MVEWDFVVSLTERSVFGFVCHAKITVLCLSFICLCCHPVWLWDIGSGRCVALKSEDKQTIRCFAACFQTK